MTPARTPPRGRSFSKRRRSPNDSPEENPKKTDRKLTPTKPSSDSLTEVDANTGNEVGNNGEVENEGNRPCIPPLAHPLSHDFGSVNSVEASSPLTGKVLLKYDLENGTTNPKSLNL